MDRMQSIERSHGAAQPFPPSAASCSALACEEMKIMGVEMCFASFSVWAFVDEKSIKVCENIM